MKTVPRYKLTATVELAEDFPIEAITREAVQFMLHERFQNLRIPTLKLTDIEVTDK